MEIYLIHHTSLQVPPGLCYGQLDLEPGESFEDELDRIRYMLPDKDPDICYTSPLTSCRELAKSICPAGIINTENRIMDLDYGTWEGQYWDHIEQDRLEVWLHDLMHTPPPEGETYHNMNERVAGFWEELQELPATRVFIVTHAGVIRSILAHCLNLPFQKTFTFEIDFSSITQVLLHSNHIKIGYVNRT